MDKIYLKDIEIFANHGVFQEEKTLGQKFILSLELSLDIKDAATTCDLTKSVHYGELCHQVIQVFQEESLDLIESVVNKVANFILDNYSMEQIEKVFNSLEDGEEIGPWTFLNMLRKTKGVS